MNVSKLSLLAVAAITATAAPVTISGLPITIMGTDVFSGPSFVVSGNFTELDTLSLTATGTVDLASGLFNTNAAGIVVAPATTNTGAHPGEVTLSGGIPYAALLIGNDTLGFHPVFPADAANGLGDGTPPTSVTINNVPLATIFGGPVSIPTGTILEFRVNDINTGDNSGAFVLA
jgi:hypothetical protein